MKTKVLIGNDMFHGGGVENVMQTMSQYFIDKGYDVTIIASPLEGQNIYDYYDSRVHFIRNRMRIKKYPMLSFAHFINCVVCKVHNVFKKVQIRFLHYDVVIALKEGITTKDLVHTKARIKLAWFHCDHRDPDNILMLKEVFPSFKKELKCMSFYDKVVCVSKATKDSIIETIGDPGNLYVAYNPINWKRIIEQSKEASSFIKNPQKPLVVAVGRLHKVKNYPLMLKAAKLAHEKVDFDIWIIGEGNQRNLLEEFVREKGLSFVRFLGMIDNPYTIIKQADFLINTSSSESYGIAIQEAFILGIPVLAVKSPGIVECFNTDYGMIVENSKEDVAKAIISMLQNDSILKSYKDNLKSTYSLESLYEDRMKIICDLFDKLPQK